MRRLVAVTLDCGLVFSCVHESGCSERRPVALECSLHRSVVHAPGG